MAENEEEVIDMSPAAIDQRLRLASELRRLCLSLGEAGRAAGLHDVIRDAPEPRDEDTAQKTND
jgi:hypothetical protein